MILVNFFYQGKPHDSLDHAVLDAVPRSGDKVRIGNLPPLYVASVIHAIPMKMGDEHRIEVYLSEGDGL